jgi:uncharacterized protein (UPF0303 family)
MRVEDDVQVIREQEKLLVFRQFGPKEAWALGCRLRELAMAGTEPVLIEIEACGRLLFAAAVGETTPGSSDWVRRKRNVVHRFGQSSYGVGRGLDAQDTTLETRQGLMLSDYAAHGGGFPIRVRGTGVVGSVIVSGLPQREDHNLVVRALAESVGEDVPMLA